MTIGDGARRRALLRNGALLAVGAAAGSAGFAEYDRISGRRLPLGPSPAAATVGTGEQRPGDARLDVVWGAAPTRRAIALTFDDGPGPEWTPLVLDTLERLEVPGTFFMVGRDAERHASLVRDRMERHEVGSHTWAHQDLARMGADEAYDNLRRTHDAIAAATGKEPKLLRPPWGHLGGSTLHAAARMRYRLVLWSAQMLESAFPDDPAGHARHVVEQVTPGTILLAHDIGRPERLVGLLGLPQIIEELRDQGYEFRTVSDLLSEAQA